jgi:hypothetical protein
MYTTCMIESFDGKARWKKSEGTPRIWFFQLKFSEISIPKNFAVEEYSTSLLHTQIAGLYVETNPFPWKNSAFVLSVLIKSWLSLNQLSNW